MNVRKDIISEVKRNLELMNLVSESILLLEQPSAEAWEQLINVIKPFLEKFEELKASRERISREIGINVGEKQIVMSPGTYNELFGAPRAGYPGGIFRNPRVVVNNLSDLTTLLSTDGVNALYKLVEALPKEKFTKLYDSLLDDIVTNGNFAGVNTPHDLLKNLVQVADTNFGGDIDRMIRTNFDDVTQGLYGQKLIEDLEAVKNNTYKPKITRVISDPSETGNILKYYPFKIKGKTINLPYWLNPQQFKSWLRQREGLWMARIRQKWIVSSNPDGTLTWGEAFKDRQQLVDKINARISKIRGKLLSGDGGDISTYEDTESLFLTISHLSQWSKQSVKHEFDMWIAENAFLKKQDVERLMKTDLWKKTVDLEFEISQRSMLLASFKNAVTNAIRLIPRTNRFFVDYSKAAESKFMYATKDWGKRVLNTIVFKRPTILSDMVAFDTRYGVWSGAIGHIISNSFMNFAVVPFLKTSLKIWFENRQIIKINEEIQMMKDSCAEYKLENCDSLDKLQNIQEETFWAEFKKNLPYIGKLWGGDLNLFKDSTYLDEVYDALHFVWKGELFDKGSYELLVEKLNNFSADNDKKLKEWLTSIGFEIRQDESVEEMNKRFKIFMEKNKDKINQNQTNKTDSTLNDLKQKTDSTLDKVKQDVKSTVGPTKPGFIVWAEMNKDLVGTFNPLTDIVTFIDSTDAVAGQPTTVGLKNKSWFYWDSSKNTWVKITD